MLAVLAWKEYREHRAVWIAVAALTVLILFSVVSLLDPDQAGWLFLAVPLVMSGAYGVVGGAMMLAGEREGQTLAFADSLTGRRTPIWSRKLLIGAVFTLAQTLFITAVIVAMAILHGEDFSRLSHTDLEQFGVLIITSVSAYAWGMFFSAYCRYVITAAGLAAMAMMLCGGIGYFAYPTPTFWVLLAIQFVVTLRGSWFGFCKTDIARARSRITELGQPPAIGLFGSLLSLIWLNVKEARYIAPALGVVALIVGGVFFRPAYFLEAWPIFTLVVGVFCGAMVFAGNQSWRDSRFPPGKTWLVRMSFWLALAGIGAFLAFLCPILLWFFDNPEKFLERYLDEQARSARQNSIWFPPLLDRYATRHIVGPVVAYMEGRLWLFDMIGRTTFITVWLIYGFSIGQVLSLVFRKTAAAFITGLIVTSLMLAVWLPSMLGGGLPSWQLFAIPLILFLAVRILLRPWNENGLTAGKTAAGMAACIIFATVWTTGSIVYRALEVPDIGEPFDVAAFEASAPSGSRNQAAQFIETAARKFRERAYAEYLVRTSIGMPYISSYIPGDSTTPIRSAASTSLLQWRFLAPRLAATMNQPQLGIMPTIAALSPNPIPIPNSLSNQGMLYLIAGAHDLSEVLHSVLEKGWPSHALESARLSSQLEFYNHGGWLDRLKELPRLPTGAMSSEFQGTDVPELLVARALQLQAEGDIDGSVEFFAINLALSRTLRNRGVHRHSGLSAEILAIASLDGWLKRLGPQPQALRRMLAEFSRHDGLRPALEDHAKTDYLAFRRRMDSLSNEFSEKSHKGLKNTPNREAAIISAAMHVPWEKTRMTRMVNAVWAGTLRVAASRYPEFANRAWQLEAQHKETKRVPKEPRVLDPYFWQSPPGGPEETQLNDWLRHSWLFRMLDFRFDIRSEEAFRICEVRAAVLRLALAAYQLEKGKLAAKLADLVPEYLPALPLDPFNDKPFQYRVSSGEQIDIDLPTPGKPSVLEAAPGQGIIWSVGKDLMDHGGKKLGARFWYDAAYWASNGLDHIYLVPHWPKK